jgi:hypothetical protein
MIKPNTVDLLLVLRIQDIEEQPNNCIKGDGMHPVAL